MINLTIATYNIHMGLSPFRKRNVLDAIEAVLLNTKADILCIQEDLQIDDVSESEISGLCRNLWSNTVFGQTVAHPRGVQGNSIISKFPIISTESVDLPSFKGQARSLLRATIEVEGNKIEVICAHFGLREIQRQAQSKRTLEYIDDLRLGNSLLFLAGDFNDWRGKVANYFTRLGSLQEAKNQKSSSHFRTFPACLPIFCLDRIFYRNCELVDVSIYTKSGRLGKSDHLPVVARFKIET